MLNGEAPWRVVRPEVDAEGRYAVTLRTQTAADVNDPPVFLRLMPALSRFIPVAIYFTSPTYHYWGDLRSEREVDRITRRIERRRTAPIDELHYEQGQPLLAALGRQGRDFFNLLL